MSFLYSKKILGDKKKQKFLGGLIRKVKTPQKKEIFLLGIKVYKKKTFIKNNGYKALAKHISNIGEIKLVEPGAEIGKYSYIKLFTTVFEKTKIGKYTSISYNCVIGGLNHDMNALSMCRPPFGILDETRKDIKSYNEMTIIGNDVWIGANVVVIAGVKIGDGAVIGAGSIVTKDIPPYAIAVGNPAKVIKYRFPEEIIAKLLKLQWWKYDKEELADIHFHDIYQAISELETKKYISR